MAPMTKRARNPEADRVFAEYIRTGRALRLLSGGASMGLTPDHVKATPEWQAAKQAYEAAFAKLRSYNTKKV